MIRIALAAGTLLAVAASGCTAQPAAVRGVEAPGGAHVVAQMAVGGSVTQGMDAGTASYVGASMDGSVMGFLGSDGEIRWYRVR